MKVGSEKIPADMKAILKNGKKPKESFWNLPFRLYSTQHKAQIISARIEKRGDKRELTFIQYINLFKKQ